MTEQDKVTNAVVIIDGKQYNMNVLNAGFGRCNECDLQAYCLRNPSFGNFCLDMTTYCNFKQTKEADIIKKAPMMREVLLQCLQYMQKSPFLRNEQLENAITALVKEP